MSDEKEPKIISRVDKDGNYVFENVEEVLKWAIQKSIKPSSTSNTLSERELVLKEALEFILKYKGPEYFDFYRGSIFDVAREALKKYEESL